MYSSDSDDDCYGNIAQKLQQIKKKYEKDVPKGSLNESSDSSFSNIIAANNLNTLEVSAPKNDNISSDDDTEDLTLDIIIASNIRRLTRSKSKQLGIENFVNVPAKKNDRTKRKSLENDVLSQPESTTTNIAETSCNKGRGRSSRRGRGRGSNRGRSPIGGRGARQNTTIDIPNRVRGRPPSSQGDPNIPTFSIGNTDHYPDFSDHQQLFNHQPIHTIVLDDEVDQTLNEELSVKVYWQSSEYVKFTIRKYQKFTQIYDYFAKRENVTHAKLLFMYNDRILKIDDTPESINYNIVKFIEGGITNENICKLISSGNKNAKNGIKLKFLYQNAKKPFELYVKKDDNLSLAMIQCAEHFEAPLQKLKFIFDGDPVSGTSTPTDLEMENGDCIDVKFLS